MPGKHSETPGIRIQWEGLWWSILIHLHRSGVASETVRNPLELVSFWPCLWGSILTRWGVGRHTLKVVITAPRFYREKASWALALGPRLWCHMSSCFKLLPPWPLLWWTDGTLMCEPEQSLPSLSRCHQMFNHSNSEETNVRMRRVIIMPKYF